MYANGEVSVPRNFDTNYNPPYSDIRSFSAKSLSLSIEVTATMKYRLVYASVIYANTNISLIGLAELGKNLVCISVILQRAYCIITPSYIW